MMKTAVPQDAKTLLNQLELDRQSLLNWAQKRREGFVIRRLDSIAKTLDDLAVIHSLPTRREREFARFRKTTKQQQPTKTPKPPPPVSRPAPRRQEVPDIAPDRQKPRSWSSKPAGSTD